VIHTKTPPPWGRGLKIEPIYIIPLPRGCGSVAAVAKVRLNPGTFKHVEAELFAYKDSVKELVWLQEEILHSTPDRYKPMEGKRTGWISDPTGRAATLLSIHRRIEHLSMIVNAIQTVYERLPEEKKRLVEMYYWNRSRQWTLEGIAYELNTSRITVYRWRREIVEEIAAQIGWR